MRWSDHHPRPRTRADLSPALEAKYKACFWFCFCFLHHYQSDEKQKGARNKLFINARRLSLRVAGCGTIMSTTYMCLVQQGYTAIARTHHVHVPGATRAHGYCTHAPPTRAWCNKGTRLLHARTTYTCLVQRGHTAIARTHMQRTPTQLPGSRSVVGHTQLVYNDRRSLV